MAEVFTASAASMVTAVRLAQYRSTARLALLMSSYPILASVFRHAAAVVLRLAYVEG